MVNERLFVLDLVHMRVQKMPDLLSVQGWIQDAEITAEPVFPLKKELRKSVFKIIHPPRGETSKVFKWVGLCSIDDQRIGGEPEFNVPRDLSAVLDKNGGRDDHEYAEENIPLPERKEKDRKSTRLNSSH